MELKIEKIHPWQCNEFPLILLAFTYTSGNLFIIDYTFIFLKMKKNLNINSQSNKHRKIRKHNPLYLLIIYFILMQHQLGASTKFTFSSISNTKDDKESFLLIKIKSLSDQNRLQTINSISNFNIHNSKNRLFLYLST